MKTSEDKLTKSPKLCIIFAFRLPLVLECRTFDLCALSQENPLLNLFLLTSCQMWDLAFFFRIIKQLLADYLRKETYIKTSNTYFNSSIRFSFRFADSRSCNQHHLLFSLYSPQCLPGWLNWFYWYCYQLL